jgi:xylan 1,4-beta-xylosidase
VLANPPGGRRIGMDPIGFDENGNLFVRGPTETPQWAPGVVDDPARQSDSGSIPLTVNKLRAMNARSTFSSQRTGHEAPYAVDNSNGTCWEPAEDDKQPSLTLDLGPATEFDPVQQFMIDSCRIEFITGGGFGFRSGRRSGTTQPTNTTIAHQYKIEASADGAAYTTVLDKTENNITKYIEFEEILPAACRFVRLTITDWPRIDNANLGIMEFTVFGKPIEP